MSCDNWTDTTVGDWAALVYGKGLPQVKREQGSVPVFSSAGLTGSNSKPLVDGPGVVIGRKGTVGSVHWASEPFWPIDTAFYVTAAPHRDLKFTYWLFRALGPVLATMNTDSAVPGLNRDNAHRLSIRVPPLEEQRRVAAVLDAVAGKLEANARDSQRLWDLARCCYRGALSSSPISCTVGDIVVFHNRRRCPLSAQERAKRPGNVPYYGATGVFGFVDEALFDQVLVLVGEDGTVITSKGHPVTQYIWGRAWVNNHAHVLTGDGISTETALLAIERASIAGWVTGAVQPKLNMGNLKQVAVAIPNAEQRRALEPELEALFALVRSKSDENMTLTKTLNELLPKLVSGKLRVADDYLADAAPVTVG